MNGYPYGTQYRLISSMAKDFEFLDEVVARMIRQAPQERPGSIGEVKASIQRYQAEAVSTQRISRLDGTVIQTQAIDDPLANEPPRLVGVEWGSDSLALILDREVSSGWIRAFGQMSNYSWVMGIRPEAFSFSGRIAHVSVQEHQVQPVIDNFKNWLPNATQTLKHLLEQAAQREEAQRRNQLRREREEEERRLRVLRNIKI